MKHCADMINSLVMKTFKSQLDIYSHPDFVGRFRAQCLPMVQVSIEIQSALLARSAVATAGNASVFA